MKSPTKITSANAGSAPQFQLEVGGPAWLRSALGCNARAMRLATLTLIIGMLSGCSTNTPLRESCRPPTGDELVHDLGYKDVSRSHILAFLVEIDDRPLYVETALVAFELQDGKWRMAHVFRHPKERLEHFRVWQVTYVFDAYCEGIREFDRRPTKSEVDQFLRDSWWHSRPDDGFRLIRRDDFSETWRTVLGFFPKIPREKHG